MIQLPALLAGPMLRRLEQQSLSIWFVSSVSPEGELLLYTDDNQAASTYPFSAEREASQQLKLDRIQLGEHAWVNLLQLKPEQAFTTGASYYYDLQLAGESLSGDYAYQGKLPGFVYQHEITELLHGSCRLPHHHSEDGLIAADNQLAQCIERADNRPTLLMMSGDQIYADDVATPMLFAIHQLIERLGLFDEQLPHPQLANSQALYTHPACYAQRQQLLPQVDGRWPWSTPKPVFTSVHVENHLVTLAECFAMYLLCWSKTPWQWVDWKQAPSSLRDSTDWQRQLDNLLKFEAGLDACQRLFANLPCYMMFDDHDVTDDWNLTAAWEQNAYGNPFAKQVLGNCLFAYWLCQGWGNDPQRFGEEWIDQAAQAARQADTEHRNSFYQSLFSFNHWHYQCDTFPKLMVLDTRTQRWRSEQSLSRPSGLLDWEKLCELQQGLLGEEAVIIVSPAPMFGVKAIEAIQKLATWLGLATAVDAENWMAHPGAASTLLNIFTHTRTPSSFTILSGDVHYSFVYDIRLRFRRNSPYLCQITSSGIKNNFPPSLLKYLERTNRLFFAERSIFNLFTRRKRLKLRQRIPSTLGYPGLLNQSGIGLVRFDRDGKPCYIAQLSMENECEFINGEENQK